MTSLSSCWLHKLPKVAPRATKLKLSVYTPRTIINHKSLPERPFPGGSNGYSTNSDLHSQSDVELFCTCFGITLDCGRTHNSAHFNQCGFTKININQYNLKAFQMCLFRNILIFSQKYLPIWCSLQRLKFTQASCFLYYNILFRPPINFPCNLEIKLTFKNITIF